VGQGTPVRARSGHERPGRAGCKPFSHRYPVKLAGKR
jgi:hypothetical protein